MNTVNSAKRRPVPLIVVVGPTASGKSALAIKLALRHGGEIICADSRTIYRGMDIGTAKPSRHDQSQVPHWGLDLVNPGERFTAADFKKYADGKIAEIRARGNIPLLVGGSGLYINAVIYDYSFSGQTRSNMYIARKTYEAYSLSELLSYCNKNNIELPENYKNKRYIINVITQNSRTSSGDTQLIDNCYIVGIATDKDVIKNRIHVRLETMFDNGVVNEAKNLAQDYSWNSEAMTGNIYPLIGQYLSGELDKSQLQQKILTTDWRLAKRQLTWFRRDHNIYWSCPEQIEAHVAALLD